MVSILSLAASAQVNQYISSMGVAAVDDKGVRHAATEYPRNHPPWLDDCVKAVGPDYPYDDRRRHHTGVGWYRLYVDLRTGAVTKVAILKSSGYTRLDNCVVAAFQKWRYKPGKWKEIDTPVTFTLGSSPPPLPPGSIRLPKASGFI